MCEGLNDAVPQGSTRPVVGIGKVLCWGALPLVVGGDSVALPFAANNDTQGS